MIWVKRYKEHSMIEQQTTNRLERALARLARIRLASLPTPLEEAPRLSARLGVRVLVKRDDETGLAMGGNKVRKLEFLIADALEQEADAIITTGGSQSNHARITAAACRRTGLACYLVLDRGVHPEPQGNLLLDRLLGAQVRLIESQDPLVAVSAMEKLADELRAEGHRPYIIPRGGSVPIGALGYVNFVPELLGRLDDANLRATHIYVGTGSTGTHSGIIAGLAALDHPLVLQGISVSRDAAQQSAKILELSNVTLDHLALPMRVDPARIHVDDRFRGPGYGVPIDATMEAIEIAALDEGLILDPVYTGKTMSGLIGHAREGRFNAGDVLVFVHTGGAPALFAYSRETEAALQSSG
jgi:D-cysteine desulfhydrase family pyridoxal phosphate-dependent enzyme